MSVGQVYIDIRDPNHVASGNYCICGTGDDYEWIFCSIHGYTRKIRNLHILVKSCMGNLVIPEQNNIEVRK